MKPLLFILILLLCSTACSTPQYAIGMSQTEFLKHNHNAELVGALKDVTVYRIEKVKMASWENHTYYYYFKSGLLAKIDQGVPQP
ncbi:MAG TPA: hypothetical protein VGI43_12760, partial [Mucilaginibacter sp.]